MKKALIINPFGIGDAIFSMALVEALKKTLPQITIGFVGNERTIALLRMNSRIDVCHEFNRDALRAERRKGPLAYAVKAGSYLDEIRKENYDTTFDLSLGREFGFAAFLAGIRRRVGFNYKGRGVFLTDRAPFAGYEGSHVVDKQLSLLRLLGIEPPQVSSRLSIRVSAAAEERASALLSDQGIDNQRFFAVAPGGGKSWGENASYKQWSPERFAQTADRWAKKNGLRVLLLGDKEEESLLLQVRKSIQAPSVIAAGAPLETVAALLKRSEVLLCNDGGLVHLANALGVKTVSLYGPVDEKVYGPYGQETPHVVLTEPVPCRPCYKSFQFPPCVHARRCLDELSVEKVLAAVEKIS